MAKLTSMRLLNSRYGVPRYVVRIDDDHFQLKGHSKMLRMGENFIDMEGGPFVALGCDLGFGMIVGIDVLSHRNDELVVQLKVAK
jgi:hypothetical protein